MTLRAMFEQWQTESGRCEEMYLAHDGERYVFNDVQSDWLTFQEAAQVIVRECAAVAQKHAFEWTPRGYRLKVDQCLRAEADILALLKEGGHGNG